MDAGPAAPSGLSYSENPAAYRAGVAISPNTPSLDAGSLPVMFSAASALPAGLVLSATSGVITGTPERAGPPSTVRITATSSAGATGVDLAVSVGDAPRDFSYATNPGVYRAGLAITAVAPTLDAGWLPVSFAVADGGALPMGLTLNASTGVISGTPLLRAIDGGTATIVASNDAGSAAVGWRYFVFAVPSPFDYSDNVAYYQVGHPIRPNVPTADVAGGLTYTASTTMPLPAGLTVDSATGVITGTPTAAQAQLGHTITKANPFGSVPCLIGIVVSNAGTLTLTPGSTVAPGVSYAGPATYDVTGPVALVNDGVASVNDGCESIANDVSGKIALAFMSSTCTFRTQAGRAQAAGAVGVILVDSVAAPVPPNLYDGSMLGVNIPIMTVRLADGQALQTQLMNGAVTATLHRN